MKRLASLVVPLLAASMLFSTAPGTFAAGMTPGTVTPTTQAIQVNGTIVDYSPISLTIKETSGDIKAVKLTADTTYFVNGLPASTRPTFHYGQPIRTQAQLQANGSFTALTVSIGRATGTSSARVSGGIIDFSSISLTVRTRTLDVFGVRLTATTRYFVEGRLVAQRPQFHYGEHARVVAHREQDGSLNALRVYLGTTNETVNKRIVGTIIDFSPISFTIRTGSNDVFGVELTGTTRYVVNGQLVAQKPDFHYGEHIAVLAHMEANGSLDALTVHVGSLTRPGDVYFIGTIIDFSPVSVTFRTAKNDVFAVKLTAATVYFVHGQRVFQKPDFGTACVSGYWPTRSLTGPKTLSASASG